MTAIILAAGYGTRLRPITLDKPKALLKVGGKTILDRLVKNIENIKECTKIIIITNDKFHGDFDDLAKSGEYKLDIEVINDGTVSNETRLGAIGDINFVLEKDRIDDDILIAGSDNLFLFDLKCFTAFGQKKRPFPSLVLFDVKDIKAASRYGICSLNKDLQVRDFEEKPASPKSTLAATAIYFIPKEKIGKIFDYMKTGLSKDAPGNLMRWFVEKDKLFGYCISGTWYDIGDVKSLKAADKEFKGK